MSEALFLVIWIWLILFHWTESACDTTVSSVTSLQHEHTFSHLFTCHPFIPSPKPRPAHALLHPFHLHLFHFDFTSAVVFYLTLPMIKVCFTIVPTYFCCQTCLFIYLMFICVVTRVLHEPQHLESSL